MKDQAITHATQHVSHSQATIRITLSTKQPVSLISMDLACKDDLEDYDPYFVAKNSMMLSPNSTLKTVI